jgi:hypothetical protein
LVSPWGWALRTIPATGTQPSLTRRMNSREIDTAGT